MQRHHYCDPLPARHPVEDGEEFELVADVQVGGGLVEHNDLRFLADRAGKQNSLALSVTDSIKGPLRELPRVHDGQRLVHFLLVRIA